MSFYPKNTSSIQLLEKNNQVTDASTIVDLFNEYFSIMIDNLNLNDDLFFSMVTRNDSLNLSKEYHNLRIPLLTLQLNYTMNFKLQ